MCQEHIIDSLSCVLSNNGSLLISEDNNVYWINNTNQLGIGDGWDAFEQLKYACKTYVSFQIPEIEDGYHVISATLNLYVIFTQGNSEINLYPIFELPWGTINPNCIISPVDYGNTLDAADWNVQDISPPINIFNSTIIGWNCVDITDYYLDDINSNSSYSQYVIRMQYLSDWDYNTDIVFIAGAATTNYCPYIIVEYAPDATVISENQLIQYPISVLAHPNPFFKEVKFSVINQRSSISSIGIFDIKGQQIKRIDVKCYNSKKDIATWNGEDNNGRSVKPGVYIAKINSKNNSQVMKIIKIK
jgi:hypothetical protein